MLCFLKTIVTQIITDSDTAPTLFEKSVRRRVSGLPRPGTVWTRIVVRVPLPVSLWPETGHDST